MFLPVCREHEAGTAAANNTQCTVLHSRQLGVESQSDAWWLTLMGCNEGNAVRFKCIFADMPENSSVCLSNIVVCEQLFWTQVCI